MERVGVELIEAGYDDGSEFDLGLDLILEGLWAATQVLRAKKDIAARVWRPQGDSNP